VGRYGRLEGVSSSDIIIGRRGEKDPGPTSASLLGGRLGNSGYSRSTRYWEFGLMHELIVTEQGIQSRIFTIRGRQVMLDRDLAELYQVETKVLNQAVKRNIKRFPENFRFQLTKEELENLRSQFVTFKENLNTKYLPYAFTEQGVSMLSAVLKSDVAIEMSIKIIEAFVAMRRLISSNTLIFERFERIEQRLSNHDENFDILFKALEDKSQIIDTNGNIYPCYLFMEAQNGEKWDEDYSKILDGDYDVCKFCEVGIVKMLENSDLTYII